MNPNTRKTLSPGERDALRRELRKWVAESLRLSIKRGYKAGHFIEMWMANRSERTLERLVISGEIQSGFARMVEIGLIDWSMEQGVINFAPLFTNPEVVDAAKFRLNLVKLGLATA